VFIELAHRRDTGPELLSYREWLAGELGLLVARVAEASHGSAGESRPSRPASCVGG